MKWLADRLTTQRLGLLLLVMAFASHARAQGYAPLSSSVVRIRAKRHVVVSILDRKLAVLGDGKLLRTFAVAVGADNSPSPTGEFQIVQRLTNPTYYHPGIIVPPGKENPLGPRWVGLSQKGFGIHSTNQPRSVGHAKSHGCIRMRNHDIEQFFAMVNVGETVEIRGERDQQIAQIFGGEVSTTVAVAQIQTPAAAGGGH